MSSPAIRDFDDLVERMDLATGALNNLPITFEFSMEFTGMLDDLRHSALHLAHRAEAILEELQGKPSVEEKRLKGGK